MCASLNSDAYDRCRPEPGDGNGSELACAHSANDRAMDGPQPLLTLCHDTFTGPGVELVAYLSIVENRAPARGFSCFTGNLLLAHT
jgi:hypothetical protein